MPGSPPRWWRRTDAVLRVTAALLATLPASVFAAAALARWLPLDRGPGFAVGLLLAIPLWLTAMCATFLVRRGWLAWIAWIAIAVVLGLAVPDAVFWPALP